MTRERRTLRSQENGIITQLVCDSEARLLPLLYCKDMRKSEFGINYSGLPVKTRPGTAGQLDLPHVPHDRDQLADTFDTELLRDDHGSFLPDNQRSLVGVGTNITQRDGHVGNFEYTVRGASNGTGPM